MPNTNCHWHRQRRARYRTRPRELRRTQTSCEALLWQLVRGRRFLNLEFRRQRPFSRYYLDFFCEELGLVVEIDGVQHLDEKQIAHDTERTKFLESRGLTVTANSE